MIATSYISWTLQCKECPSIVISTMWISLLSYNGVISSIYFEWTLHSMCRVHFTYIESLIEWTLQGNKQGFRIFFVVRDCSFLSTNLSNKAQCFILKTLQWGCTFQCGMLNIKYSLGNVSNIYCVISLDNNLNVQLAGY